MLSKIENGRCIKMGFGVAIMGLDRAQQSKMNPAEYL